MTEDDEGDKVGVVDVEVDVVGDDAAGDGNAAVVDVGAAVDVDEADVDVVVESEVGVVVDDAEGDADVCSDAVDVGDGDVIGNVGASVCTTGDDVCSGVNLWFIPSLMSSPS
jgi:hypothetical protein